MATQQSATTKVMIIRLEKLFFGIFVSLLTLKYKVLLS